MTLLLAGLVLGGAASQQTAQPGEKQADTMLIEIQSEKSLAQLREEMPKAAQAHKFGVLAVHDLGAKMKEKGLEFAGEVLVFEVCNPAKAKAVLEKAPQAASLLPCRISAYRGPDGKTILSTVKPTRLVAGFGVAGLETLAAEVEKDLAAIMNEAK
jgi:uncharacterized protein (DUF302 family)